MGQDLRDCHSVWKRRVSQKVVCTKLDAIGMEKRYSWTVYKAVTGEKFKKVSNGVSIYDEKYFGLYASHDSETTNFENYKDERANLLKTPLFKYGFPACAVVLFFAVRYLYGFFHSAPVSVASTSSLSPISVASASVIPAPAPVVLLKEPPKPVSYVEELSKRYKPRLSGLVTVGPAYFIALIEFLDESYHVKEHFSSKELIAMGWTVTRAGYGVELSQRDVRIVVRQWPVDPFGRVAEKVVNSLSVSNP
jgi:zona occludens toxin